LTDCGDKRLVKVYFNIKAVGHSEGLKDHVHHVLAKMANDRENGYLGDTRFGALWLSVEAELWKKR